MSGGVDSSVAALLLKREGHEVVGMTLDLRTGDPRDSAGRTAARAQKDAEKTAEMLGIPFRLIDCRDRFRDIVVNNFIETYAKNETPNPCVLCNRSIKFDRLLEEVRQMGADFLATGHYANLDREKGIYHILKGSDPKKDQSYFLYRLNQEQLSRAVFPLGRYRKEEVREIAEQFALPVADKPESQDVCFLGSDDYRAFLRERGKLKSTAGPIITSQGEILGEHDGLQNYTVGQRRGLGVSYREPLYVLALEGKSNALVVGTAAERERSSLSATDLSFTDGKMPKSPIDIEVKIRYSAKATAARLKPFGENRVDLEFDRPVLDATPGQSVVFYRGDRLLGGGFILP